MQRYFQLLKSGAEPEPEPETLVHNDSTSSQVSPCEPSQFDVDCSSHKQTCGSEVHLEC